LTEIKDIKVSIAIDKYVKRKIPAILNKITKRMKLYYEK